jgi:hypothetical protein
VYFVDNKLIVETLDLWYTYGNRCD